MMLIQYLLIDMGAGIRTFKSGSQIKEIKDKREAQEKM